MTSIETAIKFFEERKIQHNSRLNADEVLRTLYAMKQFERDNQIMVGVGYKRYDGVEFTDTPTDKMYEGGFAVIDKK